MPQYTFQHPKTGKTKDIFQSIHDEHVFTDEKGVKWERIFTAPFAATDVKMDCDSSKEFVAKTAGKKGTLGDLWDRSNELSEKRKERYGKDPHKETALNAWSKKRKGRKPFRTISD